MPDEAHQADAPNDPRVSHVTILAIRDAAGTVLVFDKNLRVSADPWSAQRDFRHNCATSKALTSTRVI
jgi:hypothetical protein